MVRGGRGIRVFGVPSITFANRVVPDWVSISSGAEEKVEELSRGSVSAEDSGAVNGREVASEEAVSSKDKVAHAED